MKLGRCLVLSTHILLFQSRWSSHKLALYHTLARRSYITCSIATLAWLPTSTTICMCSLVGSLATMLQGFPLVQQLRLQRTLLVPICIYHWITNHTAVQQRHLQWSSQAVQDYLDMLASVGLSTACRTHCLVDYHWWSSATSWNLHANSVCCSKPTCFQLLAAATNSCLFRNSGLW